MTPVEQRILDGLARFWFLTREQMHRLAIARDPTHLGDVLRRLDGHGLIGTLSWGTAPGIGRLPRMYYLKKAGARALGQFHRLDDVPHHIPGQPRFGLDHFHRRACVDLHIALWRWTESGAMQLAAMFPYYAPKAYGSGRLPLDGKRSLVPDAIFVLERGGEPSLFALEMCMDRRGTDRARIMRQLEAHRDAIRIGAIGDRLGVAKSNRVLLVFENAASLKMVRDQINTDDSFLPCRGHLWFNTLDRAGRDWGDGWADIDDNRVRT